MVRNIVLQSDDMPWNETIKKKQEELMMQILGRSKVLIQNMS